MCHWTACGAGLGSLVEPAGRRALPSPHLDALAGPRAGSSGQERSCRPGPTHQRAEGRGQRGAPSGSSLSPLPRRARAEIWSPRGLGRMTAGSSAGSRSQGTAACERLSPARPGRGHLCHPEGQQGGRKKPTAAGEEGQAVSSPGRPCHLSRGQQDALWTRSRPSGTACAWPARHHAGAGDPRAMASGDGTQAWPSRRGGPGGPSADAEEEGRVDAALLSGGHGCPSAEAATWCSSCDPRVPSS